MIDEVNICLQEIHSNDLIRYLVIGSAAGGLRALSRGLTYPLDTLKTLSQAAENESDRLRQSQTKLSIPLYFRGVIPSIVSAVPANALFFLVYNTLDGLSICFSASGGDGNAANMGNDNIITRRLLISAIATLPQNFVKVPFELIKQRAQTNPNSTYSDIFNQIVLQA